MFCRCSAGHSSAASDCCRPECYPHQSALRGSRFTSSGLTSLGAPHPACGHLLPIRCGEGIISPPHPGPLLVGRGEGEATRFANSAAIMSRRVSRFPSPRQCGERVRVRGSLFDYPFDALFIRRHEPLTGHVFHHPHAARPALQRIPNGQQAALAVLPPLAVPETQRLDVLLRQKLFTDGIALQPFRQTMLETVQFHVQPRRRTIEIQNVITHRMLPAKFKTRKPLAAQCPPQIPFRFRLVTTKLARGGDRVHTDRMLVVKKRSSPSPHPAFSHLLPIGCGEGIHFDSSPRPSPRWARRGRRRAVEICVPSHTGT